LGGGFHHHTLEISEQRPLLTLQLKDVMDFSHVVTLSDCAAFVTVDFAGTSYWKEY
jgi:hypothetical protein